MTSVVAQQTVDTRAVQRRSVRLLFATQIAGGIGVAIGISVGALLGADLGGTGISGFASSTAVVGGALLALPITRIMSKRGRRPGLVLAYLAAVLGAVFIVMAAAVRVLPLLFVGMFLFGGGTAANLQARYAAVDLAEPSRRGRYLSIVVWATTLGAVSGPNLAPFAGSVAAAVGLPALSGAFVFSAFAFALAAAVLALLLRPDPLLLSQQLARHGQQLARHAEPDGHAEPDVPDEPQSPGEPDAGLRVPEKAGLRIATQVVLASPAARLGMAAVAMGHLVMVGVMTMTPVHVGEIHANAGETLRVVGPMLSMHIAGMYALSPVMGILSDRIGRRAVVLGGIALLLAACAVAGTAGHHTALLTMGLTLLGMGWSATMVAGSTLLTESVPAAVRPSAQGLSDAVMGFTGATAGALSGVVVQVSGYSTLTLLAAVATVPLIALALRRVAPPTASDPTTP